MALKQVGYVCQLLNPKSLHDKYEIEGKNLQRHPLPSPYDIVLPHL